MGRIVSRVVGSLTGANQRARATERAAAQQAAATRQAAAQAAQAARESAAQVARQQEAVAARAAAEGAAADALSRPVEEADVNVAPPTAGGSVSANARRRRQVFGLGSGGVGVNI